MIQQRGKELGAASALAASSFQALRMAILTGQEPVEVTR
jgi:hypothetical protein